MASLLRQASSGLLFAASLVAAPLTATAQSASSGAGSSILNALAPDMRNVILIYDAIKGTHLEQLTPQDARQQFSAQDAAKLLARGTGVAPSAPPWVRWSMA